MSYLLGLTPNASPLLADPSAYTTTRARHKNITPSLRGHLFPVAIYSPLLSDQQALPPLQEQTAELRSCHELEGIPW